MPSLTESLCDLGFGDSLIAVSDYCLYPLEAVSRLPRIGGPKTPRLREILNLQPDLVLANPEENPREAVEQLRCAGVPVWLSFPKTVREAIESLWQLVGLYQSDTAGMRLRTIEQMLDWVEMSMADGAGVRYFCPIWQESIGGELCWMTFNGDTYSSDLLRLLGGENIFAGRERRYPPEADLGQAAPEEPGERDRRYPRVSAAEVLDGSPEVILLPSEPFAFGESQREMMLDLFSATPAVRQGRVYLLDGTLISWYGTRLARALDALADLFIEERP